MLRSSKRARREFAATLAALIEGDAAPARLVFYDGDLPSSPDEPVDQQALAILFMRSLAFHTDDSAGTLTAWPIDPRPGLLAGMPEWARLFSGDGEAVFDIDVGLPGSDATLILDFPIRAGEPVAITEFTIRF